MLSKLVFGIFIRLSFDATYFLDKKVLNKKSSDIVPGKHELFGRWV